MKRLSAPQQSKDGRDACHVRNGACRHTNGAKTVKTQTEEVLFVQTTRKKLHDVAACCLTQRTRNVKRSDTNSPLSKENDQKSRKHFSQLPGTGKGAGLRRLRRCGRDDARQARLFFLFMAVRSQSYFTPICQVRRSVTRVKSQDLNSS